MTFFFSHAKTTTTVEAASDFLFPAGWIYRFLSSVFAVKKNNFHPLLCHLLQSRRVKRGQVKCREATIL